MGLFSAHSNPHAPLWQLFDDVIQEKNSDIRTSIGVIWFRDQAPNWPIIPTCIAQLLHSRLLPPLWSLFILKKSHLKFQIKTLFYDVSFFSFFHWNKFPKLHCPCLSLCVCIYLVLVFFIHFFASTNFTLCCHRNCFFMTRTSEVVVVLVMETYSITVQQV